MEDVLTFEEVADKIGLTLVTLKRWTRSGKFPGRHLARGAWIVTQSDFDAWLASKQVTQRRWAPPSAHRSVRRHA